MTYEDRLFLAMGRYPILKWVISFLLSFTAMFLCSSAIYLALAFGFSFLVWDFESFFEIVAFPFIWRALIILCAAFSVMFLTSKEHTFAMRELDDEIREVEKKYEAE